MEYTARDRARSILFLTLVSALYGCAFGIYENVLPFFFVRHGVDAGAMGKIYTGAWFIGFFVRPLVGRISDRMDRKTFYALAIAVERAQKAGIEAEAVVRHGKLVEALESAAQEEGADAIAFGRPAGVDSSFSLSDLEAMAARITEDTGIETFII